MTLIKGYSHESIQQNIRAEITSGKSQQQAIAIAMHVAGVARKKKGML